MAIVKVEVISPTIVTARPGTVSSRITSKDDALVLNVSGASFPKEYVGSKRPSIDVIITTLDDFEMFSSNDKFVMTPIVLSLVSKDGDLLYHFRDVDLDKPFIESYDTRIHNLVVREGPDIGFKFGETYACYLLFKDYNDNAPAPQDDQDDDHEQS